MNTIKTILTTEALFSDDGSKRYLLRKEWDKSKSKLAIIMLAPSSSAGIELDTSTQLVVNNVARLGFGSVDILNLSAVLNDFSLKQSKNEDKDNIDIIINSAKSADVIVYAAGVGKAKNKIFQQLQETLLKELLPFQDKLNCLCNADGSARFQHPLSPSVRIWHLSPFKASDIISDINIEKTSQKKNDKDK
ncbi:MAG: DUF1643 domain-containing protein [Clostridia bacterium]|nr:DUF1643 domain-containing protein [Clostridia bacterium]